MDKKEKQRQYNREWYARNIERVRAYKRATAEKQRAWVRDWRRRNKKYVSEQNRKTLPDNSVDEATLILNRKDVEFGDF